MKLVDVFETLLDFRGGVVKKGICNLDIEGVNESGIGIRGLTEGGVITSGREILVEEA